ncbi:unnamed protein product [Oikopleura dioica]|uniref:SMB domain-containing protein n=1 Tax=Oikopleura dioica TaxID=34765 RepID=E4Y8I8_OIKDI|nr:unnamed protein product [Oikopleura dioica]
MKLVGLFVASSHGQLLPKLEFKGMPVPAHLLNLAPVAPETTTTASTTLTSSRSVSLVSENTSTVALTVTTTAVTTSTTEKATTRGVQSIEEFLFSMENEKTAGTTEEGLEIANKPVRGGFNLTAAMEESRELGYGPVTGARLRFAGTPLGDVAPIYLCKNRTGHCCDNKDPDCFTPGGCFCDSSCRAFDDCCPDFEDECVDKKCLTDIKKNSAGKLALRGIELRRMRHPEVIMVASGGQPAHVEPDGCCDGVPYNHGMKCCCNGALTDNCPCQAVTKAVTEA